MATMPIYFATTLELEEGTTWNGREPISLPIKGKVMGKNMAWTLNHWLVYQGDNPNPGSLYEGEFMLESANNPLRTISYDIEPEFLTENQATGPFQPNKWYTVEMNRNWITLTIKLEGVTTTLQQNQTLHKLYEDNATKDVEVHCGDLVIKAHKTVIGLHSDTLRVAFSHEGLVEGRLGIYRIDPENMSPAIVQDIIKWMYMHYIEDAAEKVEELLAAADYLQIADLKEMCGRQGCGSAFISSGSGSGILC
jgi:hypothetical protein